MKALTRLVQPRPALRGATLAGLIAGLLLAACDGSSKMSADDYLARGQTSLEKGKVRDAIKDFVFATRKQPDSVKAHWSLAQAYLAVEDGAAAEAEIKRARELGLHRQSVVKALAEALMMQAKFDAALEAIPAEGLDSPGEVEAARFFRGLVRLGQGDLDRAREEFENAQKQVADSSLAVVGFARIALAQGDIELAGRRLAQAEGLAAESRRVLELRGDYEFARGGFPASEAAYAKVIDLWPQDARSRLAMARAQLAVGKTSEAIKNIDFVLEVNSAHLGAAYLRAVAALDAKDYATVRLHADTILRTAPHAATSLLAGAAYYARGQFQQSEEHLDRFLQAVPASEAVRRLIAAAATRLGQDDRAAQVLQAVGEKEVSDADLLAEIRNALLKSGDYESATRNLQRLADLQFGDGSRSGSSGFKSVAIDIMNEGVQEPEPAGRSGPTADRAAVARVIELLRSGKNDEAVAEAEAVQAAHPQDPDLLVLAGLARAVQGDIRRATAYLERAVELRPGDPQSSRVLAVLAVRTGDIAGARKRLETVLQKHPGHPATSVMLADLEARAGRPAVGIALLENAIAKNPSAIEINLPLARLYYLQREFDRALATVEPLLSRFPTDPALLELVGRAELGGGRHAEAVSTLKSLVEAKPDSIEARLLLANAYASLPDTEAAKAELDAVLAQSPNHREARIMLARLAVNARWFELAEKLVAELRLAYRDEPSVAEIEGGLRMAQQRPREAVSPFRKAYEKSPSPNRVILLARAQWAAGEREAAEKTFQEWLDDHPDDRIVRFSYASYLGSMNRLESARFEYQTLVDQSPDDPVARNELAYFLIKLGEPSVAIEHARRAIDLSPENANIIDTLASALLAKGDTGEAVELFHRALVLAPDNRTIRFHFAKALARQGDATAAKQELGKILADATPFDERADAEKLMQQLGG